MLGAEIGTCADTLLASIGRSPQAVRTGLFHLCFNIFSVTLGVLFVTQLVAVALWLPGGGDVPREIANAHVVFNVSGALLLIPFTPWIARLFEGIVPEKSEAGAPARRPAYST
jgi:phosphate:Na+ symporter